MSISKFNSINKRKYMEGVIVLQNLFVILLITFSLKYELLQDVSMSPSKVKIKTAKTM